MSHLIYSKLRGINSSKTIMSVGNFLLTLDYRCSTKYSYGCGDVFCAWVNGGGNLILYCLHSDNETIGNYFSFWDEGEF